MSATFFDYDNDGRLGHLHRQHVECAGPARHVGADVPAGCDAGGAGAVSATCPRQLAVPQPRRRPFRRCHRPGARGDGPLGLVLRRVRLRQRRLGRPLHRQRHADARSGAAAAGPDLESFFWRQVVARSPLTRIPGTSYDEAWRAINQLLVHGSIASQQRNVFLRNDGHGGFDEISGALGLDLDQDGRSFALLDLDRDGDEDLVLMAARQAPQLRVFRNDFATLTPGGGDRSRPAALAVRLAGVKSNRDAIGARVTVETDRMRRTKTVQAGSGFLSQHSKELLFGLGASERIVSVTVDWPSGGTQTFSGLPLDSRVRIVEGGTPETTPFAAGTGSDVQHHRRAVAPRRHPPRPGCMSRSRRQRSR